MSQYILTFPVSNKIYYSSTPKEAAKKAFIDLVKYNNHDQSRIILKDNNTKKEYNYIGITNSKLNIYKKLLNERNPVQLGGGSELSDQEFYKRLSKLSGNINVSVGELSKILKEKYEPKTSNEIVLLVKEGINKLDKINENIKNMNEDIYTIRNKFVPDANLSDESDTSISPSVNNLVVKDLETKNVEDDSNNPRVVQ